METEVIYQNQFQKEYFLADSRGKIDIILSNYVTFQHQLSGIEKGIKLDIKVDQDFRFRKERGDLGVRVRTSGYSDPIAREAIRNVELDRAFDENDLEGELEKTSDPDVFRRQIRMLHSMEEDFLIIQAVIDMLTWQEGNTLKDYYTCQRNQICLQNVADDKDINVKTIYQKVWRVKSKIRMNAIAAATYDVFDLTGKKMASFTARNMNEAKSLLRDGTYAKSVQGVCLIRNRSTGMMAKVRTTR